MTDLQEYAKRKAVREYGVVDESGHLDYDGAAFARGILHLAEQLHREDVIEAGAEALWLSGDDSETPIPWPEANLAGWPGAQDEFRRDVRATLAAMLAKITEGGEQS